MSQIRAVGAIRLLTGVAALAGVTACGGGGGPTAPNPKALAAHFDSLYVNAILAGTHGDTIRSNLLTYLEIAAAAGAAPVSITVNTANGQATWQALSFAVVDTSGNPGATTLAFTIAYSDAQVTNAVLAEVTSTGSVTQENAEMVAADTIYLAKTSATALETVTAKGACSTMTGFSNPIFPTLASQYHCTLASFLASLNATFPGTTGVDPALASISFASVTSNGVRLANASP